MKTNESKLQEYRAALRQLLRKCFPGNPGGDVHLNADPPPPRLSPLDRITEHLRRLGLGQQVRVRFEVAGQDFVLEDADGLVHAKDYDEAVILIERIWLYRP